MKTHDTYPLGPRRLRMRRVPTGKRVSPRYRDIEIFKAIHHHGPLSADYLHEFTKHIHQDPKSTRIRLRDLFHEDATPHGGAYLMRPLEQASTIDARYNKLVYDLTPAAERVLQERGLWSENAPKKRRPFPHTANLAAFTASLELGFRERGIPCTLRHQILDEADTTLSIDVSYPWNKETLTGTLEPDSLITADFGHKQVTFAIEWDEGTERGETDKHTVKSYKRSILQYRELVGRGLYKEHYRLGHGMVVLYAFKIEAFRKKFMRVLGDITGSNNYIATQTVPDLPPYFKPPPLFTSPFDGYWERVGQTPIKLFPWT